MIQLSRRFADLSEAKRSLLAQVLRREGVDASLLPIQPRAATVAELPLSYAQQSLWFMCHLASDSAVYNLPSAVRLRGALDHAALERAFNELIRRHESLRTRFPATSGKPRQEILPALTLRIPKVSCTEFAEAERERRALELANAESQRPFDLNEGPLMRVVVYALGPQDHLVLFVFHHLIWDGWSIGVMTQELAVLYGAFAEGKPSPLPELPIQFADYALWQRGWLAGETLEAQVAWWEEKLRGVEDLRLPTDRPRPALPSFAGGMEFVNLSEELSAALDALSQRAGTTLFMTLLAGFQLLLSRYSEQELVPVGTPIANRRRREVEGLIGYFANILVLATDVSGDPSFTQLLARVKDVTTGAYAHQDIPFELLVDKLRIARDPSRNPLFQVMFAVHQESIGGLSLPGLEQTPVNLGSETTHFDLGLHLWRRSDGLKGYVSYNKDLFDPLTVLRLISHFTTLLEAVVRDPERNVSSLPILSEPERAWLLERARVPAVASPRTVVEAIAARIAERPEATALVMASPSPGAEPRLTYGALGERAGHVARRLSREDVVGLLLPPGPDAVAAVLGGWRAGAVLVPFDHRTPREGLPALVAEAGVTVLLTASGGAEALPPLGCEVVYMDALAGTASTASTPATLEPGTPAYLSRASGRWLPVTHGELARRIARLSGALELQPGEALLGTAPSGFDFLALEVLAPLASGATAVLASGPMEWPKDGAGEPLRCAHFTPAGLAAFVQGCSEETAARLSALRVVLCSGGPLRPELVQAFRRRATSRLLYLFAPPGAVSEVSAHVCQPGGARELTVAGKPALQPVFVLDRAGQLAPVGVPGTIHVARDEAGTATLPPREALGETPVLGRWTAEGVLEVLGTRPGTLWWEGQRLDLDSLSAAFTRSSAVEACHVVAHVVDGLDELVAYVVPAAAVPLAPLEERFRSLLPEPAPRLTVVPVSTLPLAADGRIDERALAELESIDAGLVERWEQRLSQVPGVARVKVVATDAPAEPRKLIHVNDLLPKLRMNGAVDRHSTSASVLGRAGGELSGKPAISDGGPLELPEDAPKTLTEAFLRTAQAGDGRGITLYQDEHGPAFVPYAELLHAAKRILSGLRAAGLGRGDSVILQLENLRDHFASFWACVLGGISPVCVTTPSSYDRKNSVLNKLYNVWELLRRPAILTNEHLVGPLSGASSLYGQAFRVLAVNALEQHPPTAELHPAEPTDVVFFQLTSGSTGIPKCIQETHRGIIHHIHGSARFNGYTSEDVTLNWLPMDHVVPILTCHLKDTYLGLRQIHVRTPVVLADPLKWLDLMERHRVTHSWSPNFGFKLVNDALAKAPGRSWDLSSLKLLMNAGEQVTVPVIDELLRRTAPFGVREQVMQPAFGMAEVCTCMTYANDYAIGKGARRVLKSSLGGVLREAAPEEPEAITFVDLGPPMPGVQIRITDGENRVVPERVIGRFQIKGNVTTPGYLYNDEANREAFVGDGWFNSGDLGFIRDGRLTITGREKEMIIVRGANFYCYELEDAVGSVEGVEPTFVAACAVDDPSTGSEGLALFFVPKKPGIDVALIRAIKERVTQDFGLAPSFVVPLAREAFPKTTSGKIQRTHLKKELARGAFDDLLKGIDLAAENENTVPEWFFRRVWQRKEPRAALEGPRGRSLVFADAEGLGDALCERLGEGTVRVRIGAGFQKLGRREYALDPRQPEGYAKLLAELQADGVSVERVFHLWTYGPPADPSSGDGFLHDAQATGAASLLSLSKALAHAAGADTVRLLVGSSHVQARGAEDRIAFERAPVLGLVKTIPQEWPRLDCRHVDLPLESAVVNAERLIREALAPGKDREVAYRDGGRWVPRLEKAALEAREELPFQRGELVLLSGGLGGIGLELAKWLLEQHGVRLLLVGRTPLDAEAPEETADGLAVRKSLSERTAQLHKLAQHGEISYGAADIADEARVRELVHQAEARWGTKLAGVVHLAGVFPARLLEEETPEGLARTLRPKLEGAWVLERVLGPEGFFVAFGSIHGAFGGAASGAYAAANAALEAFVEDRRRRGLGRSFLLAWSNWDETGMSRGYLLKEPSLAQGYEMISPRRGIWSLLAGLRSGHRSLLVGVDARQPNVRRHLAAGAVPLRRLMAYVAPAAGHSPAAEARAVEVADRHGRRSRCELLELPELPVTPSGEVDVARLLGMGRRRSASEERVPPRTGVERTIAAVWREVLGVEGIDIHTSFFAMGGQSILLIQVLSKLKQSLNRELSVVELFRYPTVSALAAYLGKEQAAKPSFSKAAERAQKQREAVRQRVVPPRGRR